MSHGRKSAPNLDNNSDKISFNMIKFKEKDSFKNN
jgi:hypothetical protein